MPHPFPYSIKQHGTTLDECDHEPVQTPGCIQTHGVLLALRPSDLTILQVSENCETWLGKPSTALLNSSLSSALGEELAQTVQNALREEALERTPLFLCSHSVPEQTFDVCLHTHQGVALLELERVAASSASPSGDLDFYTLVRKSLSRFQSAIGLKQLAQVVTEEISRETHLDRVMVYYFHADDSGEVIAETKRDNLGSWLGWRYPSHDIPKPARDIFKKIWSRPVPDVRSPLAEMVPLLNPDTKQALDMTYCSLRGASVMYTEYLANMGVAAALTLPLIMEGELWGLIACHHYSPQPLPYRMRAAGEFLAKAASQQMQLAEEREGNAYRTKLEATHQALISKMVFTPSFEVFTSGTPHLLSAMDASGAALFYGSWHTIGLVPGNDDLNNLARWLSQARLSAGPGTVYATAHLSQDYSPGELFAGVGSGILAYSFSREPLGIVIWFRQETLQTFTWAGNPHELPLTSGPHGTRLTPRKSFEIWREEVRERSLPWKRVEIDGAKSIASLMSDLLVGHWLKQRDAEKTVMEAAERLRIAVEAANLGTWDFYPQEGNLRWSLRCKELFGVAPNSEVTLETFFTCIHPNDRGMMSAATQEALKPENRERFDREFRVVGPANDLNRWIRSTGQTFLDENSNVTRFAGTVQDITEKVKARDQLEARGEELQALVDQRTHELTQTIGELEAFSYSVSHDMRSPLLAMQGFSQALLEEYSDQLDKTALDYVRRIQRSSLRLDLLVRDVLAYSKVSKEVIRLSPIGLKGLFDELVDSSPEFQEPQATVNVMVNDITVMGHEAMLNQVVSNLLSNAVKFHRPDVKPVVAVTADSQGGKVRVSFIDNGIGIAETDQSRIFQIFERLNPKTMFEGTGIGLAIVKKAMERMAGKIGVTVNEFGGCTFWFELPTASSSEN